MENTNTSVEKAMPMLASGPEAGSGDGADSSSKLFCCQWVRRRVLLAYREELFHILKMTGPLLLSRILSLLLPFVITMFCGRLGNEVLAGYGLACAAINISTAATGCGLAMACDTLVSQTYGGRNLLRVGVILQRSVIILLLFCLPCWALLINAEAILLSLGQDPGVARIAQLYIIAYLPAVPAMFIHQLLVSYLQNQGIILPQMYTAALANIANIATNYILLYWLDLGVNGSAAANTLSQVYICAFLLAYMLWKKLHVKTWGGWSSDSLQEWGSYMKLAIPSTMMVCFEWWIYEFGGFLAGLLSENDLAAQHAVIMLAFINYMFPLSIQAAVCVRVGNALGAGNTSGALIACKVSLTWTGIMAVIQGLVLGSTKTVIGSIFTSDETIIDLVSQLMNVYCVLQFFDGLVCVCAGIILGSGRQKIAAVANLVGYYCIGLPLGIVFMFVAKLRVLGFWLGLLICVCIQSTFYIVVIFKLNWKGMTEEAVKRARKNMHMALLTTDTPADIVEGDETSLNGVSAREGAREGHSGAPGGHIKRAELSRARLSTSQLVLVRGLTAFAAAAVLAVGVCVRCLVPLPDFTQPAGNATLLDWTNGSRPLDPTQAATTPADQ